jgi:hypothetical protein
VQLDGLLADVPAGAADLQPGTVRGRDDVAAGLLHHRRPQREAPGQLQGHVHVRRAEGQGLEPVQGDAELLPRLQVRRRGPQCGVHGPDRLVAVRDPGLGQRPLDGGRLVPAGTEDDGGRALEPDVGRACAVVGAVAGAGEPGGVTVHEEQAGPTLDDGADNQDVGARPARHRLLDAGQRPAVAALRRRDALRRRAPAGAGLGVREDGDRRPLGDAPEDLGPLFRRPDGGHEAAGQHDRLDERLGRQHPPDLLRDDRHLYRAGAHAAVLLGEGQAQHAHLGQPRPGLLIEARVGLDHPPALLAVGVGPGQQAAHRFAQVVLLAVVGEVHGYLTTPGSSRR